MHTDHENESGPFRFAALKLISECYGCGGDMGKLAGALATEAAAIMYAIGAEKINGTVSMSDGISKNFIITIVDPESN